MMTTFIATLIMTMMISRIKPTYFFYSGRELMLSFYKDTSARYQTALPFDPHYIRISTNAQYDRTRNGILRTLVRLLIKRRNKDDSEQDKILLQKKDIRSGISL